MTDETTATPENSEALAALVELVVEGTFSRVVVTPVGLSADGEAGCVALEGEDPAEIFEALYHWDEEREPRVAVIELDGAWVLLPVESTHPSLDGLVERGALSPMVAGLLDAAVALGRNVLIADRANGVPELALALGERGTRPALISPDWLAAPECFTRLEGQGEADLLGADRTVVTRVGTEEAAEVLVACSGVVATVEATRLDRALMRLELGLVEEYGADQAALGMLAGVDLVVVMRPSGNRQVELVGEIVLDDHGYRPQVLASRGLGDLSEALVPVARPSFLGELEALGAHALVDDWAAVEVADDGFEEDEASDPYHVVAEPPYIPEPELEPEAERKPSWKDYIEAARADATQVIPSIDIPKASDVAPLNLGPVLPPPTGMVVKAEPGEEAQDSVEPLIETLAEDVDPGWELDRLAEGEMSVNDSEGGGQEDAIMAAAYGLAPPPIPAGMAPVADPSLGPHLEEARRRADLDDDRR